MEVIEEETHSYVVGDAFAVGIVSHIEVNGLTPDPSCALHQVVHRDVTMQYIHFVQLADS